MSLALPNANMSLLRSSVQTLSQQIDGTTGLGPMMPRLKAPIIAGVLPVFDALAHTGMVAVKVLPATIRAITFGKVQIAETATVYQVSLHVYRVVCNLFFAVFALPASLVSPRAVVWLHDKFDLNTLYDVPKHVPDWKEKVRNFVQDKFEKVKDVAQKPQAKIAMGAVGTLAVLYGGYTAKNYFFPTTSTGGGGGGGDNGGKDEPVFEKGSWDELWYTYVTNTTWNKGWLDQTSDFQLNWLPNSVLNMTGTVKPLDYALGIPGIFAGITAAGLSVFGVAMAINKLGGPCLNAITTYGPTVAGGCGAGLKWAWNKCAPAGLQIA